MSTKPLREEIEVCISARDWQSSEGDFQPALLRALERNTKSRWRAVCANILVECIEPYRTLVLRREILETLRAQQQVLTAQQHQEIDSSVCPDLFTVKAEMHTPLIEDKQASIMFKRSAAFLTPS